MTEKATCPDASACEKTPALPPSISRVFRVACAALALVLCASPSLAATLRGKVNSRADRDSTPLRLLVTNQQDVEIAVLTTDEQGRFELELPAGSYNIYAVQSRGNVLLRRVGLTRDEVRNMEIGTAVENPSENGPNNAPTAPPERPQSEVDGNSPIDSLQKQMVELEQTVAGENTSLAKLVNPFPVQKRGRWHGSIYHFHRNDNVDARNFFDPVGEPLPEYKRNQFGASIGANLGDRVSILGLYEGLRIVQGSTLLSHVPSAAMKQGDFGELAEQLRDPTNGALLPGNRIPQDRIHPVARNMLQVLPDPNRSDPDRNFVNNQPRVINRNYYSVQADWQPDDTSKIFVRYSLVDGDQVRVHELPSFGWDRTDRNQDLSLSYTRSLSSRLVTNIRFSLERDTDNMLSVNAGSEGLLQSLGIAGLTTLDPSEEGYPEFSLAGYAGFGDSSSPATDVRNDLSFESTVSYTHNDHDLRFSIDFDVRQINNNRPGGSRRGQFTYNGYYSGDAFADFLFGLPDGGYREIGSDRSDLRFHRWDLFVGDNWRINPKFSFNYGLTYHYFDPYRSVHDNVSTFYPLLFEPPENGEIVTSGSPRAIELGLEGIGPGELVRPDRNNWGSRMSTAYSPFGNQQLVLRTSYSISNSQPRRSDFLDYLGRNYPFQFVETSQSPITDPELDISNPFEATVPTELRIRSIDPQLRNRYTQSWRLSVQSEVMQGWIAEASYRGDKGANLSRRLPANIPLPGEGFIQDRRPNPNFGSFEILTSSGSYSRHALNLSLERRLSQGLSFKPQFTWQRLFSDSYRGQPSNPRNLRAERAPSGSPVRRFSLNYIYDLPFGGDRSNGASGAIHRVLEGWRVSGITHIQDGRPFTVTLPGDPNNDGLTGDRPDRLGSGQLLSSQPSIDKWFQTGDFGMPLPNQFGNSARNVLTGPSYQNWDVSLVKVTPLSDGELVEFRIAFFNAFNHVNFDSPDATLGTSPFGKIFGARRSREIEIALKYSF